jgi:hypothetical protein
MAAKRSEIQMATQMHMHHTCYSSQLLHILLLLLLW